MDEQEYLEYLETTNTRTFVFNGDELVLPVDFFTEDEENFEEGSLNNKSTFQNVDEFFRFPTFN